MRLRAEYLNISGLIGVGGMGKAGNKDWFKEPVKGAENQSCCPKCYAAMTPEAVLCMLCGYNRTSGHYVELPRKPAAKPQKKKHSVLSLIITSLAIILLTLALAVYVFYEPLLEENRALLSDAMKEQLPQKLNRPFNPKWMRRMTKDALIAVYEKDIEQSLLISHPPYSIGDTIILRSESGKSGKGVFQGADGQDALLLAGGKMVNVPFQSLEMDCRLRADKAGRRIHIYETASKRAEAFLRP